MNFRLVKFIVYNHSPFFITVIYPISHSLTTRTIKVPILFCVYTNSVPSNYKLRSKCKGSIFLIYLQICVLLPDNAAIALLSWCGKPTRLTWLGNNCCLHMSRVMWPKC
jgi:hypothetical protein